MLVASRGEKVKCVQSSVVDSNSNYILALFVDIRGALDYLSCARNIEKLRKVKSREPDL